MNLSVVVQAHPARAALAEALAVEIGDAEIVYDPEPDAPRPSAWRSYRACLEATPPEATHRLIVQDDAVVCRDFRLAAERAIAAKPDRLVAFFIGGQNNSIYWKMRAAGDRRESWLELTNLRWSPTVALSWPVEKIEPVLAWIDKQPWKSRFAADDERIGRALRAAGDVVLATVPSLVEHPDVVPSLGRRRKVQIPNQRRQAACPLPEECDPTAIEW